MSTVFRIITRGLTNIVLIALVLLTGPTASALSPEQKQVLESGIPYFNVTEDAICGSSNGVLDSATTVGQISGSTWTSGEQPPYYLEDYVINILKDVAKKLNVPEESAVTQEHVTALIAWAYAEGGNIANTGAFNIWNTGLLIRPDLVAGATNASGVQAFKSFDAGVEANAISVVSGNQNRIGKIITQPNSTAEQVIHAVAYYDETSGDQAWAWGPRPNEPAQVLEYNHTYYINTMTSTLRQTRSQYSKYAGVVLGPGERSSHYVNPSQLKFKSSADTTNGGSGNANGGGTATSACGSGGSSSLSPECKSAAGNAKIICAAKLYDTASYQEVGAAGHQGAAAWHKTCPVIGPSCILDCSGLVNIAIYDVFGKDLTDNTDGERSDPNFKSISFADLKPGDLLQPNTGHVEIVDHIQGNSIFTFGAHSSSPPQQDQISPTQYTDNSGNLYLRYVGPGATAP